MQDYKHEYSTTLNGGAVTVIIDVTWYQDEDCREGQWEACLNLSAVYFEDTDILPVLDVNTQTALEMEAIYAMQGDSQ